MLHCWALKDIATLWAAVTFLFFTLLGDAPQRHRGHHLGASSSVWRSSRRGPACSSTSSSSDASFCTCLEHARNVMELCSFMRRAEWLAQQPLLSGAVVFGACVCGRVTTRLVQTCVVTIREPVGSTRRPWCGNIKRSAGGHVHTKQDDLCVRRLTPLEAENYKQNRFLRHSYVRLQSLPANTSLQFA